MPFRQEKTAVAAITAFYQAVPACLWLTDPGGMPLTLPLPCPKTKKAAPKERPDVLKDQIRRYNAGRA